VGGPLPTDSLHYANIGVPITIELYLNRACDMCNDHRTNYVYDSCAVWSKFNLLLCSVKLLRGAMAMSQYHAEIFMLQRAHRFADQSWSVHDHWGHCGMNCGCCRYCHFELLGVCQGCELGEVTIWIYNALGSMILPRYKPLALLLPLLQRFSNAYLAKHVISFLQPRRCHCRQAGVIVDSLLTKSLRALM